MLPHIAPPQIAINVTRQSPEAGLGASDSSPASAAVAAFSLLDQVCGSATNSVNAANFGPFSNSGSCSYDCGFMEQKWNWNADFTTWVKSQNLLPGVVKMDASSGFTNAFATVQQWLVTDLPVYSASITGALNVIRQTDAAIVAAGGVETPAQAQALSDAFSAALAQVQGSLNEANNALQTLSSFISYQSGSDGWLQTLNQACQSSADSSIAASAENLIGQLACGGGEAQDQFNAMQSVVDASFVSLQPPFATVNSQFETAMAAASLIAGDLVNIQTMSALVTAEVNKTQGYSPISPLRTLHLNLATTNWTDLVTYAQAQLST